MKLRLTVWLSDHNVFSNSAKRIGLIGTAALFWMFYLSPVMSLLSTAEAASAVSVKSSWPYDNERIRLNYRDTSRFLHPSYAISIDGTPEQIYRVSRWLDQIYQVPYGRETIDAIMESGNRLVMRHSIIALRASGRSSAPISSALSDGAGEDALILFDTRIPDSGSHHVYNRKREAIAFSALHNLFHELVHARHFTNGTWRYFDSEGQAIEEENIFRREIGELLGVPEVAIRVGKRGKQVWWPENYPDLSRSE